MKMTLHRQRGFSLIELLVAFSIMAMSLGILYRATGSSARNIADVERYQHALVLAESLLNSRDGVPETGWNEKGRSGSFEWDIRSAPFATDLSRSTPGAARLHEVSLTVAWGAGESQRQLELVTLLPQGSAAVIAGQR